MPAENRKLASDGYGCDLMAPLGPDAHEEGMQRAGRLGRRPGRLDQHRARMAASNLADAAMMGRTQARLWQTRRRPDGTLRLANRCVALAPTIPAENPEPKGTPSAMYKPDWIDPELGESIEESDEQEAIQEGLF